TNSVTRLDGLSWTNAGFKVGQKVQITGEETGTRTITGFGNSTCPSSQPFPNCGVGSVMFLLSPPLSGVDGVKVVHVAEPKKEQATGLMNISVQPAVGSTLPTSTLTRLAGSFLTDGFSTGQQVWITGYAGPFTISGLTASSMTVQGAALTPTLTGLNAPAG